MRWTYPGPGWNTRPGQGYLRSLPDDFGEPTCDRVLAALHAPWPELNADGAEEAIRRVPVLMRLAEQGHVGGAGAVNELWMRGHIFQDRFDQAIDDAAAMVQAHPSPPSERCTCLIGSLRFRMATTAHRWPPYPPHVHTEQETPVTPVTPAAAKRTALEEALRDGEDVDLPWEVIAEDLWPVLVRRHALTAKGLTTWPMKLASRLPLRPWKDATEDPPDALFCGPPCDVGILPALCGTFVLDGDEPGVVEKLFADHGWTLPETYRVRTRRGMHFYFRAARVPRTVTGVGGYAIDVKGIAGTGTSALVPAAGNTHPADPDVTYTAEDPDAAIADAPPELLAWLTELTSVEPTAGPTERLFTPAQAEDYVATAIARLVAAPKRNDGLNDTAVLLGHFVPTFWSEDDAAARLTTVAEAIGLERAEIGPTIASGLARGMAEPYALAGITIDAPEFWAARPELTMVREVARGRLAGPWAVLGVALAYVDAFTGPQVVLPPTVGADGSLNLFTALVGKSGGGKDIAQAAARFLIAPDEMGVEIPEENVATGQGMAGAYMTMNKASGGLPVQYNDTVFWMLNEIDELKAQAAMSAANIMPTMRSIYSGASIGGHTADPTRRRKLREHRYRAAVVAGVQPARSGILLHDVDAGTPQRWVWLPVDNPGAREDAAADDLSAFLAAGTWRPQADYAPLGPQEVCPPAIERKRRVELAVCETATAAIREARLAVLTSGLNAAPGDLDGHALFTRLKVAALLGIWSRSDGKVSEEDWTLAGQVMAVSDATREVCVRALRTSATQGTTARGVARAVEEDAMADHAVKRVARNLTGKLGEEWISRTDLRNRVAARDRQHFDAALERLVASGAAEARETTGQGRQGTQYRAKP